MNFYYIYWHDRRAYYSECVRYVVHIAISPLPATHGKKQVNIMHSFTIFPIYTTKY